MENQCGSLCHSGSFTIRKYRLAISCIGGEAHSCSAGYRSGANNIIPRLIETKLEPVRVANITQVAGCPFTESQRPGLGGAIVRLEDLVTSR